ncbi:hypothetical protein T07_10384, partial [Trichinella nelsoni]
MASNLQSLTEDGAWTSIVIGKRMGQMIMHPILDSTDIHLVPNAETHHPKPVLSRGLLGKDGKG